MVAHDGTMPTRHYLRVALSDPATIAALDALRARHEEATGVPLSRASAVVVALRAWSKPDGAATCSAPEVGRRIAPMIVSLSHRRFDDPVAAIVLEQIRTLAEHPNGPPHHRALATIEALRP
jgi:hypothetical protein